MRKRKENPGIYILTCKVNGKQYVGMDMTIPRRINEHLSGQTKRCPAIHAAIQKYGKEAFTTEVIPYPNISRKALYAVEQWYIQKLNTRSPHGYNLTDGGMGPAGHKHSPATLAKMSKNRTGKGVGAKRSDTARKNISDAKKGKELSPEHRENLVKAQQKRWQRRNEREKMSRAKQGQNTQERNHFYGKTHTPEALQKISENSKKLTGMRHWKYRRRRKAEWMFILSVARVLYESELP